MQQEEPAAATAAAAPTTLPPSTHCRALTAREIQPRKVSSPEAVEAAGTKGTDTRERAPAAVAAAGAAEGRQPRQTREIGTWVAAVQTAEGGGGGDSRLRSEGTTSAKRHRRWVRFSVRVAVEDAAAAGVAVVLSIHSWRRGGRPVRGRREGVGGGLVGRGVLHRG